jgi:hypothetical protein
VSQIPAIETCCHVPLPEYCLVGDVIDHTRPHCARCRECNEMVRFERYDADGQQAIREMYADTVLSNVPPVAPVERPIAISHFFRPVIVDTW